MIFRCTPVLSDGEHFIKIAGQNLIGNIKQLDSYEKYFEVSENMKLLNAYNYPNPFKDNTNFTFRLTQIPEEVNIKIFTVAGRLIKEIKIAESALHYDFNAIPWDGRDQDGDVLANGLYFYKVIAKKNGVTETVTQKMAIVR
jgi:flagellar hook assembly protein FlgD